MALETRRELVSVSRPRQIKKDNIYERQERGVGRVIVRGASCTRVGQVRRAKARQMRNLFGWSQTCAGISVVVREDSCGNDGNLYW